MKPLAILRGTLLLSVVSQSNALAETIDYRTNLSSRMAIETEDGSTQTAELVVEPEVSGHLADWGNFKVLGLLRVDAEDRIEPDKPAQTDSRSSANRRLFITDHGDAEIREAYADIFVGEWFARLGKQQVVWGEADGLRVLDQVNPLSYREFILGDLQDRRIPLWMVNLEHSFALFTLQLLWIPDHTYNDVPSDGIYKPTSPLFLPDVPLQFTGSTRILATERPHRLIADDDYGLKLSGFSKGWDWSINTLYAYDDSPVTARTLQDDAMLIVAPRYERSLLIGASASNAFGKYTLRAESAYFSKQFVFTRDPNDKDGLLQVSITNSLIGLDYQANADTLFSTQLLLSLLSDSDKFTIPERSRETLTLLTRREFYNDTLTTEALLIHSLNDGDGLLQVSANYNLSDAISLELGFDMFYGNVTGTYGQFDHTDRFTLAINYGF